MQGKFPLLITRHRLNAKSVWIQRRVFDTCKYVGCLQRSNIRPTDDPIVAVQSRSILTKSGQKYAADTIVSKLQGFWNRTLRISCQSWYFISTKKLLATGFSLTQYDVELIGRNDRSRKEHWNDFGYKEAYKSIAMSEFPNFFYVLGPNSGTRFH